MKSKEETLPANSRKASTAVKKLLRAHGLIHAVKGESVSFSGFGYGGSCFAKISADERLPDEIVPLLQRLSFDIANTPYSLGGGAVIISLEGPSYPMGGSLGRKDHQEPEGLFLRRYAHAVCKLDNLLFAFHNSRLGKSKTLEDIFTGWESSKSVIASTKFFEAMREETPENPVLRMLEAPEGKKLAKTLQDVREFLVQVKTTFEGGTLLEEESGDEFPADFRSAAEDAQKKISDLFEQEIDPAQTALDTHTANSNSVGNVEPALA